MERLVIFKDAYVNTLRGSIEKNLSRYREELTWHLDIPESQRDLESSFSCSKKLVLQHPEGNDLKDFENAVTLHQALPFLTPLYARDPRLWTRLTHVELWSYMRKRWPVESVSLGISKKYIESRYFVTQRQSRSLLRNGAARLWWSANVTYTEKDGYELTRVLFSKLDIAQQILERSLGRSPPILKGFLSFLAQNEGLKRDTIRQLAKFLNMQGGVCVLDSFAESEIIEMLKKELPRIESQGLNAH